MVDPSVYGKTAYEPEICSECGQEKKKSDAWVAVRWKPVLDKYGIPGDEALRIKVARAFEDITDMFKRILPIP